MTHRELIAVLRRHHRCCERFGWHVSPDLAYTYDGNPLASALSAGEVDPGSLGHVVGPLVLWCWSHGIEPVRIEGTWQAYTINEEIKALSGVHAEPWLALLQACEEHEETPMTPTLSQLAAEVVRIHAEETKPKQPDDGLPPGPWDYMTCPDSNETRIYDRNGKLLGSVRGCDDRSRRLAAHIVRAGSAGVRGLFATHEVTDEKQEGSMGLVYGSVHCWTTQEPSPNVVCWLTPRGKP